MKIKMTGHDKQTPKFVTAAELDKVKKGQKKGYFYTDIEYNDKTNPIEVTFTSTTYIDKALAQKERDAVVKHEKRHFDDFKKLAGDMKKEIEALKEGSDAQLGDRIAWLTYDRCQKSNAFHREQDGYGTEWCDKPSADRPK